MKHYNNIIKTVVLSGLLYSASSIVSPAPAHAQISLRSFTISPATIEQAKDPGSIAEGTLKIINDTDTPLTFDITTNDFFVDNTQGTPNLLPNSTLAKNFSAASWVGIVPDVVTVGPHSSQPLNYYIQIPKDARPGGHYAAVVFTPRANINVQGTGTSVQTKIGTLIYLGVNGPISEDATVTQFSAPGFSEYGPVKVMTQIKNMGDLHIKPQGTITITDMLGRTIATQSLKENNIFPTAARDYVNSFGRQWMLGRFKAVFVASYGQKNNLPLTATIYFWVFPWKVAVVIVLIIVAAVLGMMLWRKKRKGPHHTESSRAGHDDLMTEK